MAVAFQTIGTLAEGSSGSTATNAPSGVVAGDALLMVMNVQSTTNPTTPSTWTYGGGQDYWFSAGEVHWYWKVADGDSTDTPTVSGPAANTQIFILRFDGAHATTPIDTSSGVEDDSDPVTAPSVTAASAGSMWVVFGGGYITESGTYTFSNSVTERGSDLTPHFWVGTKSVGSGSTGTCDVSIDSSLSRAAVFSIVLAPGAAASATVGRLVNGGLLNSGLVNRGLL